MSENVSQQRFYHLGIAIGFAPLVLRLVSEELYYAISSWP
jgi:hypothetical protein